jgi:hypothetical protein
MAINFHLSFFVHLLTFVAVLLLPLRPFSQNDPQWADEILGNNTYRVYSIAGYGCLLTDLSMLSGIPPGELNVRLIQAGAYMPYDGRIASFERAAQAAGLVYLGQVWGTQNVVKTLMVSPAILQISGPYEHYVLGMDTDGQTVGGYDPLDGRYHKWPAWRFLRAIVFDKP